MRQKSEIHRKNNDKLIAKKSMKNHVKKSEIHHKNNDKLIAKKSMKIASKK